jgi:hypothetical protein
LVLSVAWRQQQPDPHALLRRPADLFDDFQILPVKLTGKDSLLAPSAVNSNVSMWGISTIIPIRRRGDSPSESFAMDVLTMQRFRHGPAAEREEYLVGYDLLLTQSAYFQSARPRPSWATSI